MQAIQRFLHAGKPDKAVQWLMASFLDKLSNDWVCGSYRGTAGAQFWAILMMAEYGLTVKPGCAGSR